MGGLIKFGLIKFEIIMGGLIKFFVILFTKHFISNVSIAISLKATRVKESTQICCDQRQT